MCKIYCAPSTESFLLDLTKYEIKVTPEAEAEAEAEQEETEENLIKKK